MDKVIRISDQYIFKSVSAAAAEIGTPYNYLSKCIQNGKLCKGELYEYYNECGTNTTAEEYEQRVARMREMQESEKWEDAIQRVLSVMTVLAEKRDMSLSDFYNEFTRRTEERFKENEK